MGNMWMWSTQPGPGHSKRSINGHPWVWAEWDLRGRWPPPEHQNPWTPSPTTHPELVMINHSPRIHVLCESNHWAKICHSYLTKTVWRGLSFLFKAFSFTRVCGHLWKRPTWPPTTRQIQNRLTGLCQRPSEDWLAIFLPISFPFSLIHFSFYHNCKSF